MRITLHFIVTFTDGVINKCALSFCVCFLMTSLTIIFLGTGIRIMNKDLVWHMLHHRTGSCTINPIDLYFT